MHHLLLFYNGCVFECENMFTCIGTQQRPKSTHLGAALPSCPTTTTMANNSELMGGFDFSSMSLSKLRPKGQDNGTSVKKVVVPKAPLPFVGDGSIVTPEPCKTRATPDTQKTMTDMGTFQDSDEEVVPPPVAKVISN